MSDIVLEVNNLKKYYHSLSDGKAIKALNDISFKVERGKTLGIVGESGCGKSTLAKTLMGLETKTSGEIFFNSKSADELKPKERYQLIQMVFQDPLDSLNPRKKAWEIISAPLKINEKASRNECIKKAQELLERVGLPTSGAFKYPHMFSGGQRQRIGIARSLILKPEILILDEPVSALDVSIQAQILNLLDEIQKDLGLTYIFISHDLSVVNHISDDILVMYLGRLSEYSDVETFFKSPIHPYSKTLLKSSHLIDNKEITDFEIIKGVELPSPLNPPSGCFFHPRCPQATEECKYAPYEILKKGSISHTCING